MTLQFISNLMFFTETMLGIFVFAHFVPKKASYLRNFAAMIFLTVFILAFFDLSVGSVRNNDSFFKSVSYLLAAVLAVSVTLVCFEVKPAAFFYLALAGNCLRMCAYFFYRSVCGILLRYGLPDEMLSGGSPLHYLLLIPVMASVYAFFYHLFSKKNAARDMDGLAWRDVLPFGISLMVNLIYSAIESRLLEENHLIYAAVMLVLALMYFQLLFFIYVTSAYYNSQVQYKVMEQLWEEKRHQYEHTKESIDVINMKCHDLRHQLRAFRAGGATGEFVREIEEAFYIYESHVKTGNETLDIIVAEKMLLCEAKKIEMAVMASASELSFMRQTDIVSLFSNLLENAIEYEETIEEESRRFIRLSVKSVKSFLSVSVENTFEGSLEMEDGLPVSRKEDGDFHGFGLKSVRFIAEKYHGQMDIVLEDGMFRANIVFPL